MNGRALSYLALIALLPLLGYQFGVGNQVEQFPIVARLAEPTFLQGDFYVDQAAGFGPRYYYSLALAGLTRIAPLWSVILVLTGLTNFALAAVSYDAARRHLGKIEVAGALAALVVIVNSSFALGYAGYLRFESYQPANPAIVLALLGFSLLLAGRRLWAAPAFAASAMLHPLIGVEAAVIAYGACALAEVASLRKPAPVLRAWLKYVPSGLLVAAAVFAAWVLPGWGAPKAAIPDAEFFAILAEFRAPHHYLAGAMPRDHFVRTGLFAVAAAWMAWLHLREHGLGFAPTALASAGLIVLGLCAASVVFVDILEMRAFVTAQLFRMTLVLKWVGFLFFAARAATWLKSGLKSGKPIAWVGAAAPILAAGEAQPYVLLAALILVETSRRFRLGGGACAILAVLLGLIAVRYQLTLGERQDFERGVIGFAVFAAFHGFKARRALRLAAAGLVGAAIAVGVANRNLQYDFKIDIFEPAYVWDDLKGPDADIARWAKAHTPKGSLFVTPPDFEAFRMIAERPIVADFTSIPFSDLGMREWRMRMRVLYGDVDGGGFQALSAMRDNYRAGGRVLTAGAMYGAPYAILHAQTPFAGEVLYANGSFKAVKLTEGAP